MIIRKFYTMFTRKMKVKRERYLGRKRAKVERFIVKSSIYFLINKRAHTIDTLFSTFRKCVSQCFFFQEQLQTLHARWRAYNRRLEF